MTNLQRRSQESKKKRGGLEAEYNNTKQGQLKAFLAIIMIRIISYNLFETKIQRKI